MNPVKLPRSLVNRLLGAAQREPSETCGLIEQNAAGEYRLAPAADLNALRASRPDPERSVAVYCSHPTGPATPSPREHADALESLPWLIIALGTRGVLEMRAFAVTTNGRVELPLTLVGAP